MSLLVPCPLLAELVPLGGTSAPGSGSGAHGRGRLAIPAAGWERIPRRGPRVLFPSPGPSSALAILSCFLLWVWVGLGGRAPPSPYRQQPRMREGWEPLCSLQCTGTVSALTLLARSDLPRATPEGLPPSSAGPPGVLEQPPSRLAASFLPPPLPLCPTQSRGSDGCFGEAL